MGLDAAWGLGARSDLALIPCGDGARLQPTRSIVVLRLPFCDPSYAVCAFMSANTQKLVLRLQVGELGAELPERRNGHQESTPRRANMAATNMVPRRRRALRMERSRLKTTTANEHLVTPAHTSHTQPKHVTHALLSCVSVLVLVLVLVLHSALHAARACSWSAARELRTIHATCSPCVTPRAPAVCHYWASCSSLAGILLARQTGHRPDCVEPVLASARVTQLAARPHTGRTWGTGPKACHVTCFASVRACSARSTRRLDGPRTSHGAKYCQV